MDKMPASGKPTVFSVSCQTGLITDIDKKIIDFIRKETGMKLTRSGLLQNLMQIVLEAEAKLDPQGVYDDATLQAAIKAAIKKTNR